MSDKKFNPDEVQEHDKCPRCGADVISTAKYGADVFKAHCLFCGCDWRTVVPHPVETKESANKGE